MHGNIAYCLKHGHDWHTIDCGLLEEEDDIIWRHVECKRCGINHIVYTFMRDEE